MTVQLKFLNRDSIPPEAVVNCDEGSASQVMSWYAAFYSGDRYMVYKDGELIFNRGSK